MQPPAHGNLAKNTKDCFGREGAPPGLHAALLTGLEHVTRCRLLWHPAACRLADCGHLFFKRTWQYRCFIASGVADGLPALLAVAARQAAARQEAMERERELDERLEAVGLGRSEVVSCAVTSWLQRGVSEWWGGVGGPGGSLHASDRI